MRPLIELIRREIAVAGILPFARFMELALYCPNYGYYQTKKDNLGRRGDFFTSVSVGEVFGQLLAFQFADWLNELNLSLVPHPASVYLVEAGAHDGTLANDILSWLQTVRPNLFQQIQYRIIEPSLRQQEWQKEKLENFAPRVRWFTSFEDATCNTQHGKITGVIFCNELLDAMPVHRFGWDSAEKKWFEWGVALDADRFIWAKIPNSDPPSSFFHLPASLLDFLPHGYTVEISPAAVNWWREAVGILKHGRVMAIDYGLTEDELISPSRPNGTLRAYFRHHITDDILANPGGQDITAHVNFPVILATGEAAGLKTESFTTQSQFLARILEKAAKDQSFGNWTPSYTRQFQTLTHPEHLGRAFRVLVQFKSAPVTRS